MVKNQFPTGTTSCFGLNDSPLLLFFSASCAAAGKFGEIVAVPLGKYLLLDNLDTPSRNFGSFCLFHNFFVQISIYLFYCSYCVYLLSIADHPISINDGRMFREQMSPNKGEWQSNQTTNLHFLATPNKEEETMRAKFKLQRVVLITVFIKAN